MPEAGFFAQKRNSPTSLGLVILLHGALITAVVLIKSPTFIHALHPMTMIDLTQDPPDPPVVPPPPQPQHQQPQQPEQQLDRPTPENPLPSQGPTVPPGPGPTQIALNEGTGTIPQLPPPPPLPIPVRHAAQIDSSSQLQPPYPPSEQRLEHEGRVQVRVTIGPDGRVIDVALISATNDAFWQVTRQQALRHWRFRPATVDGRPVQDVKVMSLVFRITDQG